MSETPQHCSPFIIFLIIVPLFSPLYHYYSCAETSVSPRRSHKYPPLVPLGTNMSRQFILHWVKKGMPVREGLPVLLLVCFLNPQHKRTQMCCHNHPQPLLQCSGSSCISGSSFKKAKIDFFVLFCLLIKKM